MRLFTLFSDRSPESPESQPNAEAGLTIPNTGIIIAQVLGPLEPIDERFHEEWSNKVVDAEIAPSCDGVISILNDRAASLSNGRQGKPKILDTSILGGPWRDTEGDTESDTLEETLVGRSLVEPRRKTIQILEIPRPTQDEINNQQDIFYGLLRGNDPIPRDRRQRKAIEAELRMTALENAINFLSEVPDKKTVAVLEQLSKLLLTYVINPNNFVASQMTKPELRKLVYPQDQNIANQPPERKTTTSRPATEYPQPPKRRKTDSTRNKQPESTKTLIVRETPPEEAPDVPEPETPAPCDVLTSFSWMSDEDNSTPYEGIQYRSGEGNDSVITVRALPASLERTAKKERGNAEKSNNKTNPFDEDIEKISRVVLAEGVQASKNNTIRTLRNPSEKYRGRQIYYRADRTSGRRVYFTVERQNNKNRESLVVAIIGECTKGKTQRQVQRELSSGVAI